MGLGKFLGANNYSTPGKGITKEDVKNEKPVKKFFRIFFQNIVKFIELNLVCFTCCIPLVTAFFSFAGMSKVTRDFIWQKNPSVFSDFFSTMKKNFKQLLAISIINIIAFLLLGGAGAVYLLNFLNIGVKFNIPQQSGLIFELGFLLLISISIVFIIMNFYISQIAFTFDLKLKQIYKNALILTIAGFKNNVCAFLIVGAITAAMVILVLLGYYSIVSTLYIFVLLAFCNYVIEFLTLPVIQEFMIDPYNRLNNIDQDQDDDDAEKGGIFSDELVNKDNMVE